jgi:hypothetical protein
MVLDKSFSRFRPKVQLKSSITTMDNFTDNVAFFMHNTIPDPTVLKVLTPVQQWSQLQQVDADYRSISPLK